MEGTFSAVILGLDPRIFSPPRAKVILDRPANGAPPGTLANVTTIAPPAKGAA